MPILEWLECWPKKWPIFYRLLDLINVLTYAMHAKNVKTIAIDLTCCTSLLLIYYLTRDPSVVEALYRTLSFLRASICEPFIWWFLQKIWLPFHYRNQNIFHNIFKNPEKVSKIENALGVRKAFCSFQHMYKFRRRTKINTSRPDSGFALSSDTHCFWKEIEYLAFSMKESSGPPDSNRSAIDKQCGAEASVLYIIDGGMTMTAKQKEVLLYKGMITDNPKLYIHISLWLSYKNLFNLGF